MRPTCPPVEIDEGNNVIIPHGMSSIGLGVFRPKINHKRSIAHTLQSQRSLCTQWNDLMRSPRFQLKAPPLQQRLTQFHGTHVPVVILFFLKAMEVGRIAFCDKFFHRIVQHPMLWRGIHCRDYGTGRPWESRCVWQTLHGRGPNAEQCLFHLFFKSRLADYSHACKHITAIPGRLKEELMESYKQWRSTHHPVADGEMPEEFKKALQGICNVFSPRCSKRDSGVLPPTLATSSSTSAASTPKAQSREPSPTPSLIQTSPPSWHVRAHSSYGLSTRHNRGGPLVASLMITARGRPVPQHHLP